MRAFPAFVIVAIFPLASFAQFFPSPGPGTSAHGGGGGNTWFAPGANDHCTANVTSGTAISCTLGAAPTTNRVIVVGMLTYTGITTATIKDSANNTYTKAPNSPGNAQDSGAGSAWIYYRVATGVETATVNVTLGSACAGACSMFVVAFPYTGTAPVFDVDGNGNAGTTGAIVLPTLTPTSTNELFVGFCADENSCAAATSPWTLGPDGLGTFNEGLEYILSRNSALNVGFTGTTGNAYDSVGAAFKF